MKLLSIAAPTVLLVCTSLAPAQIRPASGKVFTPDSSIEKPSDIGKRSHTNIKLFLPNEPMREAQPLGPPFSGYAYETPASLGCVYGLVKPIVAGCNPNAVTANPSGGSKMIAIVDAYDAPNAAADLATFSTQFGLPAASFQVVYASGTKPAYDAGWEIEESLDVQWSHAMAPDAKIVLVEAASNNNSDLLAAEDVASKMVNAAGGGEVSNSWGGPEFAGETSYDSHFVRANVVFFASSGDSPGTIWPGTSPNVVSAGGTTVRRNPYTGKYMSEYPWDSAGGGVSEYESAPSYQSAISSIVGTARGIPDLSFDSNPITGVWVEVSQQGGWYIVGGTSVAAPSLAGIINLAGSFEASSNAELTKIYGSLGVAADLRDITTGYCGPYAGYSGVKGWDFCTGVGVNKGKVGK
jgi:kumamolisin